MIALVESSLRREVSLGVREIGPRGAGGGREKVGGRRVNYVRFPEFRLIDRSPVNGDVLNFSANPRRSKSYFNPVERPRSIEVLAPISVDEIPLSIQ